MIYFFTPYSFKKKLFEAYDSYMQLIADPEDWGCLMDGDMAFLLSDFGHQIQDYIDKCPDTGMFTCYGSRCPYGHQIKDGINSDSDSIKYIFENTANMHRRDHGKLSPINRNIAGHLMVIQKKTWTKYRDQIEKQSACANIQAVDTAISTILLKNKEKIMMMDGMQVFHYYRQYSFSEKHILSDKLTVVIRTHDRPKAFKRCIDSVRRQTHPNIEIVVGVDTKASRIYAEAENPTKIIEVKGRERISHSDFPANEYISHLIGHITDGYILILDDDNYIDDLKGVEKLFAKIDKEWCIYIIRYRYPDGRQFPNDKQFRNKTIENGGIDWASCVFHARFKGVSQSKPLYNADFYFINSLVAHARVTEWIDLDLVHTETPGMDGKTELSGNNGSTDVVYVLGTGSTWGNNEIRFSIRSMLKYFKDLRNIIIVGECPDFISGVIHIPCPDQKDINKDARMAIKVKAACNDKRVSDNFILCTDDTLLLRDLKKEDFTGWHDGPISYDIATDLKEHKGIDTMPVNISDWFGYVYATGKELKRRELPDMNYDRAHCPQPINKTEFLEVMKEWDMYGNHYTLSNIYNNSTKVFKGKKAKNIKLYSPVDVYDLSKMVKGRDCLNYNDAGLDYNLKQWLNTNFSTASPYEVFVTDTDRRTTVEKWFEKGCNYEDGLQIFKYFAPKNRLLIKYFDIRRNNEQADRKLKHTLQLWLR